MGLRFSDELTALVHVQDDVKVTQCCGNCANFRTLDFRVKLKKRSEKCY